MEKKIKKLQLNKETVAVLNGEKMSRVLGGNDSPCVANIDCPPEYICAEGVCMDIRYRTIGVGSCDPCPHSYTCLEPTWFRCN